MTVPAERCSGSVKPTLFRGGNLTAEGGVFSLPHHSHFAFADVVDDAIVEQSLSGFELQHGLQGRRIVADCNHLLSWCNSCQE